MTNEDAEEPPRLLKEALKSVSIEETGVFDAFAIGESRIY
jgi:N-acyl-phosphatidylethanolamine-hydrolysing phospholipase D